MTIRKLTAFGLNPILGFLIIGALFIGGSIYLFYKTQYAQYGYILLALSLVVQQCERKRNDFLKLIFTHSPYLKLRLIENFLVVSPFIAFLAYKQLFPAMLILSTITLVISLVNFNSTFNFTIPTPFYRRPYEFAVGFRNTFYLFIMTYSLTFIAISVGNFNLGIFSLLLVFFITLTFYSKPEDLYFVWSFIDSPKGFLMKKIRTGLVYSTMLSTPILIILSIFFFSEIKILLIFQLLGYIYLITIILAKYSAYPNEMSLPQGILFSLSLMLPPALFITIPLFYYQSIKSLTSILK